MSMQQGVKINCLLFLLVLSVQLGMAQSLSLSDFLAQVLEYHPVVKQSYLKNSVAKGKLLKARGGLDPKITFDRQDKQFAGKEYYRQDYLKLKIPTGTGISLNGFYQRNTGVFLDPSQKTPREGLYSFGLSLPLAKGFLTNERLMVIRKAKLFQKQRFALQQMEINHLLYEAVVSYVDWLLAFREVRVRRNALDNAKLRLDNVKINFRNGDKAAIDTLEAYTFYNTQLLAHQEAELQQRNAQVLVSNFLWGLNDTPLDIQSSVYPNKSTLASISVLLQLDKVDWNEVIASHPKVKSTQLKYQMVTLDRRLSRNALLPQIDLHYNWISGDYNQLFDFDKEQYKFGVSVSLPLFLRNPRGAFKVAKNKLRDLSLEQLRIKNVIENQIKVLQMSLTSYKSQLEIAHNTADAYRQLMIGEQRKMDMGDSNLFTVNYRNAKSIEATLKWIDLENKVLKTYAKLFNLKSNSEIEAL